MMILRATSSFKGDKSDTKVTYSITADTPNNTFFFFLKARQHVLAGESTT
jgi:hypothetical protein